MNLPDYSEVERLRLQLHQAELQRDAFKAMASGLLDGLIREALVKQVPNYASLMKGYDPKASTEEASYDRVTDDICTTYVVDDCVVTKAEYEVERRKRHG